MVEDWDGEGEGAGSLQPVYLRVMCEFEDELVDDAIDADCSTDEL